MDWVWDGLRLVGFALLITGGWSVADSLGRIARSMERKATRSEA